MANASTLEAMSPQLLRVVEVTTSRISGGAGWWKSPCPDLARARSGQLLRATLQEDSAVLRGISFLCVHGSILSKNRASEKPGAVHFSQCSDPPRRSS